MRNKATGDSYTPPTKPDRLMPATPQVVPVPGRIYWQPLLGARPFVEDKLIKAATVLVWSGLALLVLGVVSCSAGCAFTLSGSEGFQAGGLLLLGIAGIAAAVVVIAVSIAVLVSGATLKAFQRLFGRK